VTEDRSLRADREAEDWRVWPALALALLGLGLLVWRAERLPRPAPISAPLTAFSEGRAAPLLRDLAGMGLRMAGTPSNARAADRVEEALREVPGLEVERQEAAGIDPNPLRPGEAILWRVSNVLARLPGTEPGAIAVVAHFDSPPESVGAADDAAAVAVLAETARALAASGPLRHPVVFVLDGAEEVGLLGAQAFARHPWSREVRVVINLEAAGTAGRPTLFQVGPANSWLASVYDRSVPWPRGTAFAQDLFRTGLVPSDTSFRVFRDDLGLVGYDFALIGNGWAYHTGLDQVSALEPGTLQALGDNTLALVRGLQDEALVAEPDSTEAVFYDWAGLWAASFSSGQGQMLTLLALAAATGALAAALWRGLSVRSLLREMASSAAACAAGLCAAVALALLGSLAGRPHGWYAHPALAATFAVAALSVQVLLQAAWARRRPDPQRAQAAAASALVGAALALAVLAALGLGSVYLGWWWVAAAALSLAVSSLWPRRWALGMLPLLLPALLTLDLGVMLLGFAIPLVGRLGVPLPLDAAIALVAAVPALACSAHAMSALYRAPRLQGAALAGLGLATLGASLLLSVSPYTPSRPHRIWLDHLEQPGVSELELGSFDAADPDELYGLAERGATRDDDGVWHLPAPNIESGGVAAQISHAAVLEDGIREVELRLDRGEATSLRLALPRDRVARWSWSQQVEADRLPSLPADERTLRLRLVATDPTVLRLALMGAEPVRAELTEIFDPALTPALEQLLQSLPAWVAPISTVRRTRPLSL
jgi:hypothetical protein